MSIIRMPVSLFQINLKVMLTSYGRLCKNVGYCCYFIEVFIIKVDILQLIFFFFLSLLATAKGTRQTPEGAQVTEPYSQELR